VLKSSLTFNFARIAALHNIKTCVIGLDMQGDITTLMGMDHNLDQNLSLNEALEQINQTQGLPDYLNGNVELEDIILPTDLSSLFFIPETPELVSMEQKLLHKPRREYWLQDNVIKKLKEKFDLILLDCSPNWNQLITNALTSCDHLISPLECKINNFRNFKIFDVFIAEFKRDLQLEFNHSFVPTRYAPNKKLSNEIKLWYENNLKSCSPFAVRESVIGEEAMALKSSVPEYAPGTIQAAEMNSLIHYIWQHLPTTSVKEEKSSANNIKRVHNQEIHFGTHTE